MSSRPHHPPLSAPGLDVDSVTRIVLEILATEPRLTARGVGPGRIVVTRTHRPRAAVIACLLTVWIGGLGLLLLLVRRTDVGEIGIRTGPRGCTLSLPALLDVTTVDTIRDRVGPHEPRAAVDSGFGTVPDLDAPTAAR